MGGFLNERIEERVRRAHVEDDGLGERNGTATQGHSQHFEAVAEVVVVRDERTDAGPNFIGNTRDSRDAERGGDRRDGVYKRAGMFSCDV